ncbi:transposase [Oxalobacteraceae bacterium CAVE-383]|nr:transposase [Oxalobacteraceae bacterium CAVE-383]
MARLPRLIVPDQVHHIIQRGHDGVPVFRAAEDYLFFLRCLRDAGRRFQVALHAYVLMPDQVQLLATPADDTGLARMMQWVGRHYVPYFNRQNQRAGTLWQGRYRASVIEAADYLLPCTCFIELAPVRSGLAAQAEDYPWSSYMHHIGARPDSLITEHALYWALGNTPFEREAAYRAMAEQGLSAAQVAELESAVPKGWALGSPLFKMALQKQGGRRVEPGRRGRPRIAASSKADAKNGENDDSATPKGG